MPNLAVPKTLHFPEESQLWNLCDSNENHRELFWPVANYQNCNRANNFQFNIICQLSCILFIFSIYYTLKTLLWSQEYRLVFICDLNTKASLRPVILRKNINPCPLSRYLSLTYIGPLLDVGLCLSPGYQQVASIHKLSINRPVILHPNLLTHLVSDKDSNQFQLLSNQSNKIGC